jgi:L-lactate dehydrogenase complex protein LldG
MTAARDAILQSIAKRRGAPKPVPDYALPDWIGDAATQFAAKAKTSVAEVHEIAAPEDAPEKIFAILAMAKLPMCLHVAAQSPLNALPWQRAPGLAITASPPGGSDSAFSAAEYGIAETGTLVFFSGPRNASSWHFRPGREFVPLSRAGIVPRFEDIIARMAADGRMPATLNLVTGPSRTADIEQTIELGAHGPWEVHILITG